MRSRRIPLRTVVVSVIVAATLGAQPRPLNGALPAHARGSLQVVTASARRAELLVTLHVDPGWHVSWRNPGETGLPTRLTWRLPDGVRAVSETWPVPLIARTPVGATHTLEGDVPWLVAFEIGSPSDADRLVTLTLRYGICRDVCIPEQITVPGVLPGRTGTRGTPVPAALAARLVSAGGVIPARRRSPTELCLASLPSSAVAGARMPDFVADSGAGVDGVQFVRRRGGAGRSAFLVSVPTEATLRTGAKVLLVSGAAGVAAQLDFERPAPGCSRQ